MVPPAVLFLASLLLPVVLTTPFDDYIKLVAKYQENVDPGKEKNYVASFSNAKNVLNALYRGAKGKTLDTLEKVLLLPEDPDEADQLAAGYIAKVKGDNFRKVRAIYVTSEVPIKKDYKQLLTDVYKTQLESLDFSDPNAAELINLDTREHSDDYVLRPYQAKDLKGSTSIAIVVGILLIDTFEQQFPPQLTSLQPFKRAQDTVNVLTMNNPYVKLRYADVKDEQVEIIQLTLGSGRSWWVVLPYEGISVATVPSLLPRLIHTKFQEKSVNVSLPKFQIDNLLDIKPALQQLGINDIFDKNAADLSGIGGKPGDLFVNKFVQKTEIRVSEAGLQQYPLNPDDVEVPEGKAEVQFNANRGFYFILPSAVIGGKVVDPILVT